MEFLKKNSNNQLAKITKNNVHVTNTNRNIGEKKVPANNEVEKKQGTADWRLQNGKLWLPDKITKLLKLLIKLQWRTKQLERKWLQFQDHHNQSSQGRSPLPNLFILMTFCSYNIWGFNYKMSSAKDLMLGLIAILETHAKQESTNFVLSYLSSRFVWNYLWMSSYRKNLAWVRSLEMEGISPSYTYSA